MFANTNFFLPFGEESHNLNKLNNNVKKNELSSIQKEQIVDVMYLQSSSSSGRKVT